MRRNVSFSLALAALMLTSCGDEAGPIDPALDPIAVLRVEVSPTVDTIFAADTIRLTDQLQLSATIVGRVGPITSGRAIWISEDTTVATVSETGLVRPLRYGTVRIAASAAKVGYATIVVAPAVAGVAVTPGVDTILVRDPIVVGDTRRLVARATDASGVAVGGTRFEWRSSNNSVAVVDSTGTVRAIGLGSATITSSAPTASLLGSSTIVVAPRVRTVQVTPVLDTVFVDDPIVAGDTVKLNALLRGEMGDAVANTRIVWTSSNPGVAVVDSVGRVSANGLGTVTITASSSGVSGSGLLVVAPQLKSIDVTSPVTAALALDTVQLVATGFDYQDRPVAGRTFAWQSSNPAVATVNATGRVTTVAPGVVTIRARDAFRSDSVSITVAERRLLAVEAGGDFSCGTTALGRLYCWGRGDVGQLATPSDSLCFDESVTQIDDSTFVTQQLNPPLGCSLAPKRSSGVPLVFRRVATGGNFGCGLSSERQIYCWGSDEFGQIGNGSAPGGGPVPRLATVSNVRFDSISVGGQHACALTAEGSAYCWGNDLLGQLGDRRNVNSTTPIPVFGGLAFRSISAGGLHTCGILTNGNAVCWGANSRGQLGIGTVSVSVDQPSAVVTGGSYVSISAGYAHTCALTSDNRAFCWGDNTRGQLGIGITAELAVSPTAVSGGLSFRHIAAGGYLDTVAVLLSDRDSLDVDILSRGIRAHSCGITTSGSAFCWGDNYWRQSGFNSIAGDRVLTPNAISSGASGGFRTISTGSRHSCAYGVNGEAWCWGSNVFGALGNELQAAGRSTPQLVVRPR